MKKAVSFLTIFLLAFALCSCGKNHEGMVKTPSQSDDLKGENCQVVVDTFKNNGFTNVTTEELADIVLGWLYDDGEVEKVLVNGSEDYKAGKWVEKDIAVVIYYHTLSESNKESTQAVKNNEDIDDIDISATLTVENNTDFATLMATEYPSEAELKAFSDKYEWAFLEFDGCVKYKEYNADKTSACFLIWQGDYVEDAYQFVGPEIAIKDETLMGLSLDIDLYSVNQGDNVHLIVRLKPYVDGANMYEAELIDISLR